jgi:hypothetical protein
MTIYGGTDYEAQMENYSRSCKCTSAHLPLPRVWKTVEEVYSKDTGVRTRAISELKGMGLEGFVTFLDQRIPYDQRNDLSSFVSLPPSIESVRSLRPDLYERAYRQ